MDTSSIKQVTFREVLYGTDGSRRTIAEAARLFGKRVVDVAEIAEALDQMKEEIRPLSSPKRVFISYRWGTSAENKWVADLASKLIARGCVVELDATQKTQPPTTGSLVAKLVRCHIFLMIIDPGYIERVGVSENQFLDRGWAYVEFRVSYFLPTSILRIGLLRAGNDIPRGMTLASETEKGNVIDARTPEKLEIALNSFFQKWPVIPPEEICRRAEFLLDMSIRSALSGNHNESWRAAKEAVELIPELVDGYRFLVSASLRTNRIQEARFAADKLLEKESTRFTHVSLATLARVVTGDRAGILDNITRIAFDVGDWRKRLVAATALYAIGQRRAAAGHLQVVFIEHPSFRNTMNKLKEKLQQRARPPGQDWRQFTDGEFLPIDASDYQYITPQLEVLPFDKHEVRKDGVFLVPILVEMGNFPGLTMTHEYDLTIFACTVLGTGGLLDEHADDGEPGAHLACDHCGHLIPFLGRYHALCERCGAEHHFSSMKSLHPCTWCGGVRMTLLEPAFDDAYAGCPYCQSGRYRRIERIGDSRRKDLVYSTPTKNPNWKNAEVKYDDQAWIQVPAKELDPGVFAVFIPKVPDSVQKNLTSHDAFRPEIRIDGKDSKYVPSIKHQVRQDGVLVIIAETI